MPTFKVYGSLLVLALSIGLSLSWPASLSRANSAYQLPGAEARRKLRDESLDIVWVRLSEEAKRRGQELARVLEDARSTELTIPHDSPLFTETNEEKKKEYLTYYKPDGLDPANNELSPIHATALLGAMNLTARDAFIDLGSSRGSVVLTAATTTSVGSSTGIELSPRNHANACRALDAVSFTSSRAFWDDPKRRVFFYQGDVRSTADAAVNLKDYSVLYCAIRGVATRPLIMDNILRNLTKHSSNNNNNNNNSGSEYNGFNKNKKTRTVRLVCAGFGVDVKDKPYANKVVLSRAYALWNGKDKGEPIALYGVGEGPRMLLEYHVQVPMEDE